MPRSLRLIPTLFLCLVLLPGLLAAQQLPTTATAAQVTCQLGYDSTGRTVTADLDVTCPAGRTPSDVTWSWVSLTQDPLGVDQPVTGRPLKLAKDPGFQPLLPGETLDVMCHRLRTLQGGPGGAGAVARVSSTSTGLKAEIQGRLLVTGTCQPDGPPIHSAIRTTFTLLCGDDGLESIHAPSSTNEPSPPALQPEAGFQLVSVDGNDQPGGGVLWRHMLPDDPRSYFQLSLTRNQQDSRVALPDDSGGVNADFDLWQLDASFGCRLLPSERRVVPFVEAGLGMVFADRRGGDEERRDFLPPDPFDGVDETSLTVHAAVGGRLRIAERCFLEGGVRSRWRDSTSTTSEEAFFRLTFGIK